MIVVVFVGGGGGWYIKFLNLARNRDDEINRDDLIHIYNPLHFHIIRDYITTKMISLEII